MGGNFIRGALVEFMPTFLIPLPNVIIFQFNPETMTHAWTQPEGAAGAAGGPKVNPLAVRTLPGESFSFKLELDSNEFIANHNVVAGPVAMVTGIYPQLAALEMLQFPQPDSSAAGLVGAAAGAAAGAVAGAIGGAAGGGVKRPVPRLQVPVVLFVWGPGRIVPVRVTALSVTETLYDF